jgi:imidazole glycerol-phosphate synthase subunit HisH
MIGIINYGSGNIAALTNIFKQARIAHFLCSKPADLKDADRLILPGVGAFDPTMEQLVSTGIVAALEEQVFENDKPVLGICVGMHLLADSSEEGDLPGLGWVPGRVKKIDVSRLRKLPHLPHMGWNSVGLGAASQLFNDIDGGHGFYFLHSYFFDAKDKADVTATVDFGYELPCGVAKGLVQGVQFHPEKSHSNGTKLLRNFAQFGAT